MRRLSRNRSALPASPAERKDYVLEAGGYDPAFRSQDAEGCEDWKLYLALAERYDFAAVRENFQRLGKFAWSERAVITTGSDHRVAF